MNSAPLSEPVVADEPHRNFQKRNAWWFVPLLAFLFSRLLLFIALEIGADAWKYNFQPGQWTMDNVPVCIDGLCRYDAGWYTGIIDGGYFYKSDDCSSVSFFPVFPMTMKAVDAVLDVPYSAHAYLYIISNSLFFFGALLILYRLAQALGADEKASALAVLLVAFQPATLFFSAPYTESMFLLFTTGSLLAALKKRWALAGLLGMTASATRNLGVFLAPAVGLMWLAEYGVDWRVFISFKALKDAFRVLFKDWSWLWVLVIPMGLVLFMLFLHFHFGHALAFVESQKFWGHPVVGFWHILADRIGAFFSGEMLWLDYMEFFSAVLFLVLGVAAWVRFGAGIGVFCLCLVLIPLSATTMSMVRYISVISPSFVALAVLLQRWRAGGVVLGLFAGLSALFIVLFSHWCFVG